MTKKDLILLTINQLQESYNLAPECLTLEDSTFGRAAHYASFSIIWRRLIDLDGKLIQDPNNPARTIIVSYNNITWQVSASIYYRDVASAIDAVAPDATVSFRYRYWPYLCKTFRLLMKLRSKLIKRHHNMQHIDYMHKLISIFPTIGDDDLFS